MYYLHNDDIEFEWHPLKDRWNRRKHGVSFAEAATAFQDRRGGHYFDPDHSYDEDRFLLIGMSSKARLLIISHCYRKNGTRIRIISVRKADASEEDEYNRG